MTTIVVFTADSLAELARLDEAADNEMRSPEAAVALIREDIDKGNVQRSDLVAQAIHLLMESARLGLAQNNPGAVVGAVAQLDKLCGLSVSR